MSKNMVIIGASDGLGKCIVEYFKDSYNIVALARNKEKLKQLEKDVNVKTYVCDVSKHDVVESVIKKIESDYGVIDILINSAGVLIQGELVDNDYEKIEEVFEVNLNGLVYATKAVLPQMIKNGAGTIVNINSICTDFFRSERSIYYASKWGVDGFTKCMQQEVSKKGVKIINIRPGTMATNMFNKIGEKRNLKECLNPVEVAKVIEYILNLPKEVTIPEIVIKNINN